MKKLLALVLLAALPAALGACCSSSEARFWMIHDGSGGATAYAVDTVGAPLGEKFDATYVDASGRTTSVAKPEKVKQLTEAEYASATSGAGFGVHYCGIMKTCWAAAHEK